MNQLYTQRFADWLNGIPVYFYHVFTAVKLPLLTVFGFVVGLPLLFRRKFGDGRYFFSSGSCSGWSRSVFRAASSRVITQPILPAVLITSALGIQFVGRWLANRITGDWFETLRAGVSRGDCDYRFGDQLDSGCAAFSFVH